MIPKELKLLLDKQVEMNKIAEGGDYNTPEYGIEWRKCWQNAKDTLPKELTLFGLRWFRYGSGHGLDISPGSYILAGDTGEIVTILYPELHIESFDESLEDGDTMKWKFDN